MNIRYPFYYRLLRPLVVVFLKIKFSYKFKKAKNLPENYLVLSNHATDFDPLFVGASFPRQMFFVGSEHISRWKNAYRFLKYAFKPIMRKKGSLATSTVTEILRHTRRGDNVCLFAEGIRTWDGITCPILPSTGKLVKSAGCALVTYKIVGGYFVSPNWSDNGTRKGYIYGAPVNVYTKEQLAQMSVDEVNAVIAADLYEDAYARQLESPKRYRGKHLAEHMENLLFICPECGSIDSISSAGSTVACNHCGLSFTYDEYGMLNGAPYTTVRDFAAWQNEQVKRLAAQGAVFTCDGASLSVIVDGKSSLITEGPVSLSSDGLRCGETVFPIDSISDMDIHGRHALVFSSDRKYYELITPTDTNSLKFLLLYRELKKQ